MREELRSVDWNTMDEFNVQDSWNFFIDKQLYRQKCTIEKKKNMAERSKNG